MKKHSILVLLIVAAILFYFLYPSGRSLYSKIRGVKYDKGKALKGNDSGGVLVNNPEQIGGQ